MTVLVVFFDSSGHRIGQCDKRCYSAEQEECYCRVCGGTNHGVGFQQACEQTFDQVDRWVAFESQRLGKSLTYETHVFGKQLRLPL